MGGACVGTKSCDEFGNGECTSRRLAKPDGRGAVDGGDWLGVLGGFAVSGADEEVSRGDAGEGGGGADVWRGVSVGPHDAAAGAGMAGDGGVGGGGPEWDDGF